MTLFTKFGNWFLRNSRNVLFLHVINYVVVFQIGYILFNSLQYLMLGESELYENIRRQIVFEKHNYLYVFFGVSIIPFFFNFLVSNIVWFFMSIANKKMIRNLSTLQFWSFQISYVILFFLLGSVNLLASMSKGEYQGLGGFVFIFYPFLYFLIFWLIIEHLRRKTITRQEKSYV